MIVDIADLDVIFLSYNEPNKEHNWIDLKSKCPWAKRVDGVEGSDAAHKAAGEASSTERFVLVDGDNIVDPALFDQQLDLVVELVAHQLPYHHLQVGLQLEYLNRGSNPSTAHPHQIHPHSNLVA